MELRSPDSRRFALARPMIECAQCGERIFAPDWSEYFDDHKVRHLWACASCGYQFETIARFPGP
jgi:DNA-directed RNA polymerase subunit RPC12/RpoP